jgi:ubiquinone/menaquinone biosynthesis C-methylase UbiE
MIEIAWATPLYEFLRLCEESPLPKEVLDCGAGGDLPPLSLFYNYGYKTYGIEINEQSLTEAEKYCRENNMPLNIVEGDMRAIPFEDERFGFVYSYNAIFFMTKPDIAVSIKEIIRVLKSGGLCYVNFKSVDDPDDSPFCATAFARRLLNSERFAKFEDSEADQFFESCVILRREKRIIEKLLDDGTRLKQVMIDYITRKE